MLITKPMENSEQWDGGSWVSPQISLVVEKSYVVKGGVLASHCAALPSHGTTVCISLEESHWYGDAYQPSSD